MRKGGSFLSDDAGILPGRREEAAFFLADGPAHARDLGFRPVVSGINTPGGDRPAELLADWNKAGEQPVTADAARNPLEELDRLLARPRQISGPRPICCACAPPSKKTTSCRSGRNSWRPSLCCAQVYI